MNNNNNNINNNKVVLAFSGGLDTSFCIPYLKKEKQLEVHTVMVNTGGFSKEEEAIIEQKAIQLGAKTHTNIDALETYYQKGIKYLVFGNVLKNDTYPLSVSSERVFQALEVLKFVKKIGAKYVAHGSTGAGNDQIRFDSVFQIMAPEVEIIAPIRELKLSRNEEIDYLQKAGFEYSYAKSKYSINQGIWGTSIGGVETLSSDGYLPEDAYPSKITKSGKEIIKIGFTKGEISSVNGENLKATDAIKAIEKIASQYGVGRDIHIGDTIIGIKGRVGFEAAAPLIIIKAHHLLEKHVLTKSQLLCKDQLAVQYGQMIHEAQYLEPLARNIEAFMENSQKSVSGEVLVELMPYHFTILGCKSQYDLMNSSFGEYGEINKSYTSEDIVGFTKVISNPLKIYYSLNNEK